MSGRPFTFTELLDWVEERLPTDRSVAVAVAVEQADPQTLQTLDWIREFHRATRVMPLVEPPAEVRAAVRAVLREHLEPWAPDDFDDATLRFDSRRDAVAGNRPGGPADDLVHLSFDSDLGPVTLDIVPVTSDRVDVYGSVRSGEEGTVDTTRVVFTSSRSVRRSAACTATGEFRVRGLPTDVDEAWILRDDRAIRIAVEPVT